MSVAVLANGSFLFMFFGPVGIGIMLALWLLVIFSSLHGLRSLVSWLWSALLTLKD